MQQLSARTASLDIDLVSLLEQRQTRRLFTGALDSDVLGEFLWLACRNRSSRPSPFGPCQESRPHPSAGAMHPIHVFIVGESGTWARYDPLSHALAELPDSQGAAAAAKEKARELTPIARGRLIGLVAEPGKTAAKYENHESLVWRDAGVVIGYMSVVAEALGLSFCPLGITGQPYLTSFLPQSAGLHGVGLAILGKA